MRSSQAISYGPNGFLQQSTYTGNHFPVALLPAKPIPLVSPLCVFWSLSTRLLSESFWLDRILYSGLFHAIRGKPKLLAKVVVIEGDLLLPNMGLSPDQFSSVLGQVTVVIHSAARCAQQYTWVRRRSFPLNPCCGLTPMGCSPQLTTTDFHFAVIPPLCLNF